MTAHPAESDLMDAAVGAADGSTSLAVDEHLKGCALCAESYRLYVFFLMHAGDAAPEIRAVEDIWGRVERVVKGIFRFDHYAKAAAALFGISPDRALAVLRSLDTATFGAGSLEGVCVLSVEGGRPNAFVARIAPGVTVPLHVHATEERVVVIQGALRSFTGPPDLRRGDRVTYAKNRAHGGQAMGELPCLCLVVQDPA